MILLEATSGIEPVAGRFKVDTGPPVDPSLESEDFSEIASSISICDYLIIWSERRDLNSRPLVSQTSALTGLRHAPMPFP
jgi:hypothetical protein